jgi:hypothetical protein
MIPPWIIEEVERARRERDRGERPQLPLELPPRTVDDLPPPRQEAPAQIVIELGADRAVRSAPLALEGDAR